MDRLAHTVISAVLSTLLVTACSGDDRDRGGGGLADEYVVTSGSCFVTVAGARETLHTPMDLSIVAPEDASPEGCAYLFVIRSETCPSGCAATTCYACLHDPMGSDTLSGTFGPGYVSEGLTSCSFIDYRGGLSEDLFFHGDVTAGTMLHARGVPNPLRISLEIAGEARVGSGGIDQPASGRCDFDGEPSL